MNKTNQKEKKLTRQRRRAAAFTNKRTKGHGTSCTRFKVLFTAWSGRASEEVTFEERLTEKDGGEAKGKVGTQFRKEPGLLLIRKKTNGSRHEPRCR